MNVDYKIGHAIPFSTLNCGKIFSYEGELFMKLNYRINSDHCVVALRNGNVFPFSSDPIVVWEDCIIKKRVHRGGKIYGR